MAAACSRDMTATGRYAPVPRFPPFAFYTSVRLADPEMLARIMQVDPYFITQDNGAGAPLHFAVTYRQLDMVHHLLNLGAEVNQRDPKGLTPLHRAAHLAHLDGYLEIYELLLSRGADPAILSEDFDPYLDPGCKPALLMAQPELWPQLQALDKKYANVPKAREPHPFIGDWWTLYDYGLNTVKTWAKDYVHPFPEERKRKRLAEQEAGRRATKAAQKAAFLSTLEQQGPEAARQLMAKLQLEAAAALSPGSTPGPRPRAALPPAAAAAAAGGVEGAGAGSAARAGAGSAGAAPQGPGYAFLFPGQGSQAVGMLKESSKLPAVRAMLDQAAAVLGYDLLEKCLTGPQAELDNTEVAQPALFVAGLAAAERLKHEDPTKHAACTATAGLSLGEYSALVFAGALSFEDGLKIVKVRAQAMAQAARTGPPHGMLSVVGLADVDLQTLCQQARQAVQVEGGTVCQLANFLFPQGRVVSGHSAALKHVAEQAMARGALKAQMLTVSGAFHTRLMQPARDALSKALAAATLHVPRLPVYSNVTAQPFPAHDPAAMRELLARQLVEPVQWEGTLKALIEAGKQAAGGAGPARLTELGPGQQIKAMVRRLDGDAWKAFTNIAA